MQAEKGFGPRFDRIADGVTRVLGSLPALAASVTLVVVWGVTGPLFNFSDTWQLFINTTTTVITFWMVFVIQNSANRQSKATQLKLDELIRVLADARNEFLSLDHASESELAAREEEFGELAEVAEEQIQATAEQVGAKAERTRQRSGPRRTPRARDASPRARNGSSGGGNPAARRS